MPEYVYALHNFVPEKPDEVRFKVGDRIEVIEKDDLYQDGWWQVSFALSGGLNWKSCFWNVSLCFPKQLGVQHTETSGHRGERISYRRPMGSYCYCISADLTNDRRPACVRVLLNLVGMSYMRIGRV